MKFLKSKKEYLIIIIVSLIISIPLLNPNFDIFRDDGIQHICRMIGTNQSIQEGNVFTSIMSKFCNNFGYSWNLFYSPLTAYMPLIFKIFVSSYTIALKLFMIFITIFSGFYMNKFAYRVTKNKNIGLLAAIFYICAPYRLTDMYMRIAIAELASFAFLPLVFLGLYNIFNGDSKKIFEVNLVIGAAGLILSHSIIAMYTAIFCAIYCLVEYKKLFTKDIIKKIIVSLLFVVLITSFYWAPMLEHKLGCNYEVFKEGRMERTRVLIYYKLSFSQLIITLDKTKMIYDIGWIILLGLIVTPFTSRKIENNYKKLYWFGLISGIICCIMTLKVFPFEKLPNILKMLQFSYRLLEFSSLFFAFVAAINIEKIFKKIDFLDILILIFINIVLLVPLNTHLRYGYNWTEEELINTVDVTENTRRVHAGCASFEYLPSRAFENRSYIESREDCVYIVDGNIDIKNENKNGTRMNFQIDKVNEIDDKIQLELPYIYYLGYSVILKTDKGNYKIDTYESENGFVEIQIPNETGIVSVEYSGTNIMKVTLVISFVSSIMLIIIGIKKESFQITEKRTIKGNY